MTTDTITAIAFAILASAGWLAFAREWRARRKADERAKMYEEQGDYFWKKSLETAMKLSHLQAKYDRLTDRDERGRFVKRERV